MKPVYMRVEAVRKKKGITKTHIAKYCGHTVSWYSDLSKGRREMRVTDLEQIAEALEVNPVIFFGKKLSETLNYETA